MAASTTAQERLEVLSLRDLEFTVKTGETIKQGCLVALDSSGELVDATEATGEGPYFVATGEMGPNNPSTGTQAYGLTTPGVLTNAAAGTKIMVRTGLFWFVNGESIDDSDAGAVAYCDDNQSVKTTSAGTSPVGVILAVDSVKGVLVSLYPHDSAVPDGSITAAKIAASAVTPVKRPKTVRELAADAALVIAADDDIIYLNSTDTSTVAATMTATHEGHEIWVRMRVRSSTGKYTLGCSQDDVVGDITLDAAAEWCHLVYDGSAWQVVNHGASFA